MQVLNPEDLQVQHVKEEIMSANLPLDANDEDLIQRGLRRPSIQSDLQAINETFTAVRSSYDNAASGIPSVDNIWPVRAAEELSNLTEVERRQYLEQRGIVPPEGSLPADIEVPGIDQLVETVAQVDNEAINSALLSGQSVTQRIDNLNERIDAALNQAPDSIPTDSYGQPLIGQTTSPTPLTAAPPASQNIQRGTTGGNSSPYVYTPIDLYDDRYDFATGKVIRKGVATGSKGGIGGEDRPGNTVPSTGISDQQSEPPAVPSNVTPNDTTSEQYDDAILRQARAQEYSSPTVNNETTARIAEQEDQTVDYTDNTEADTGNWTPPPRTETSPPVERASREAIRESRRQTTQDIRNARRRGENLVRKRHPDGTYYAAPASEYDSQRLPQRVQDMGF